MNFLRAELKKVLDMTQYQEEVTYIGSCGYVRVNEDVRMRLEFFGSAATTYSGIVMTMINRKEGTIDTNALRFQDTWGKKATSNPSFKEGIVPHIWESKGKAWYAYKPNHKDYQILATEISQYVGPFQEAEMTRGSQTNTWIWDWMRLCCRGGDDAHCIIEERRLL